MSLGAAVEHDELDRVAPTKAAPQRLGGGIVRVDRHHRVVGLAGVGDAFELGAVGGPRVDRAIVRHLVVVPREVQTAARIHVSVAAAVRHAPGGEVLRVAASGVVDPVEVALVAQVDEHVVLLLGRAEHALPRRRRLRFVGLDVLGQDPRAADARRDRDANRLE